MTNNNAIYVANPLAEYQEDQTDLLKIIENTLAQGNYILGSEVERFEREFAQFNNVQHCIGVANGTDAIVYALRGLGISAGDHVITVSHTAVATVAAIELIGAVPVLADIDPNTRCICTESIANLITPQVKAIVVVHIYGQPADMPQIMQLAKKHNLQVIEDCAQAHAATIEQKTVGSIADVAAFSFYPTKNLGALGDGGAILVRDNQKLANYIRALRQYGWEERYISKFSGGNSRLDELQAGILRYRLKKLATRNLRRLEIAKFYNEALANCPLTTPTLTTNTTHAMHQYVIASNERDRLKEYLASKSIFAALHYPLAVHQQPAYLNRLRGSDCLPNTEQFYQQLLSLPVYPQLSDTQIEYIANTIKSFWS